MLLIVLVNTIGNETVITRERQEFSLVLGRVTVCYTRNLQTTWRQDEYTWAIANAGDRSVLPLLIVGLTVLWVVWSEKQNQLNGIDLRVLDAAEKVVAIEPAGAGNLPTGVAEKIISDIRMPGMDGYALVRNLRAEAEWNGGQW